MKPLLKSITILTLLISLIACTNTNISNSTAVSEDIIYVDIDANGNNDGSNWENAYTSLVDALDNATEENSIWVAEGTYYPTNDNDNSISFTMKDNVDIYGGFDGTEDSLDQRNWENNKTILSGDIGVIGDNTDNSIKVVIAANSTIDGFTITGGYFIDSRIGAPAPKMGDNTTDNNNEQPSKGNNSVGHLNPTAVMSGDATTSNNGNGIIIWKVSPTIINCTIDNNHGSKAGGVYIMGTGDLDEIPTFINTIISNNSAVGRGGGVSIDMMSSAYFIDCIFDNNSCTSGKGGAIYNDFGGSPLLENCLFINNYAQSGAAIANDGESNPIISNTTFYNNRASEAAAALYQGSGPFNDPVLIDSIIWSNYCEQDEISIYNWNECNPKVSYSIVEGGYDGEAVLDIDPMFVDPSKNNFSLSEDSLAQSASHNGESIGFNSELINSRLDEDYTNIKEYLSSIELNEEPTQMDLSNPLEVSDLDFSLNTIYVDNTVSYEGDGSSWDNALKSLQTAIYKANLIYQETNKEVDVWVADGTYYPGENRTDSFILQQGVNVYGGFEGNETSLSQRDYNSNLTILSGEIGEPTTTSDNSYHVVIGSDNALIDGITITGGNADGIDGNIFDNKGGAVLNYLAGERVKPDFEPTLGFDTEFSNIVFVDNYAEEGGAVYTYHGGNPTFNNCTFIDNSAKYGAATLDRAGTNAIYTDCTFKNNNSTFKGGAVFCDYGSMQSFYNSQFINNKANTAGGAIYTIDRASQEVPNETDFDLIDETWSNLNDIFSSVYIEDCDFINNTANTNGGAIYVYESGFAKIVDSTFINNSAQDATVVANNGATIYISSSTSFENSSIENNAETTTSSVIYID